MVGIGETYFAAFASALGSRRDFAGLIATLPMLAGASLQLATPWALRRFRSYRTWVVLCASLQAAALLAMPIAALASIGTAAAIWVFVAAALYWAASQATGPAWNTWIEEIIPKRRAGEIFRLPGPHQPDLYAARLCRRRHRAARWARPSGWLLAAFAGIFLIGSACRFLSAWFLSRQQRAVARPVRTAAVSRSAK